MLLPINDFELVQGLQTDGIQVWICSFGGCGSNMLLDHLEKSGFKVRGETYNERACHFPHPVDLHEIPAIYLYGDPYASVVSQHFRDVLLLNLYKASNYDKINFDLSNDFYKLDIAPFLKQFKFWTTANACGQMKILHLRYENLWTQWYKVQALLNSALPSPEKRIRNSYTLNINSINNILATTSILSDEIRTFEQRNL